MSEFHNRPLNLVLGITGASGALYGVHLIRALAELVPGASSLILSPAGLRVFNEEFDANAGSPPDYLKLVLAPLLESNTPVLHKFTIQDYQDIGAKAASGSSPADGMIICPCSMKSLAGIAQGYTTNLIERAADVTLKERRRLALVPRESPYSLIHLRNMTALTEAGAVILPASPGFYQRPASLEDLGRFIAGRCLNLFGVKHNLFAPWAG